MVSLLGPHGQGTLEELLIAVTVYSILRSLSHPSSAPLIPRETLMSFVVGRRIAVDPI